MHAVNEGSDYILIWITQFGIYIKVPEGLKIPNIKKKIATFIFLYLQKSLYDLNSQIIMWYN